MHCLYKKLQTNLIYCSIYSSGKIISMVTESRLLVVAVDNNLEHVVDPPTLMQCTPRLLEKLEL